MESCSGLSNLPADLDAGAALADLTDAVDATDLTLVGWQVLRLEHFKLMACLTTSGGGGGGSRIRIHESRGMDPSPATDPFFFP
jgi:hypothetical protein